MADLDDLYQELILDHSRKPRNFFKLEPANCFAEGFNPLCGDRISVYLNQQNNRIEEISFLGSGCAISKASASLMTSILKEKTVAEAQNIFDSFRQMVTGEKNGQPDSAMLGKLAVFSGVSEFPVRVKCATLAWHTLRAALDGKHATVSTEED